jgi:hypothetical protein
MSLSEILVPNVYDLFGDVITARQFVGPGINGAAGNAAAIDIPPNSSTTNQNATTVSFKRLA